MFIYITRSCKYSTKVRGKNIAREFSYGEKLEVSKRQKVPFNIGTQKISKKFLEVLRMNKHTQKELSDG